MEPPDQDPTHVRVVFNFQRNTLDRVTQVAGNRPLGDVVSDALNLYFALRSQAAEGFTEIVTRNPATEDTRLMTWKRLDEPTTH
jgi:hypothetical protein